MSARTRIAAKLTTRRLAVAAGVAAALALSPCLPVLADDAAGAQGSSALAQALSSTAGSVPATLTAEQLDTTVVGSYVFDGETVELTARQIIEDSASLESARNADGTYDAPTADMVLTYARNQILNRLVEEAGITVSDEELAAYAEQTVGTGDIAQIAGYYGMDEEQAGRILREAAAVVKLRDSVVGSVGTAPQPPVAPADGDVSTATEEYGAYVLGLVGTDWDGTAQTWANTESAYYEALAGSDFDGTLASYGTAQTAYYIAYSLYQEAANAQSVAWTDYMNGYLGAASIAIYTLRA